MQYHVRTQPVILWAYRWSYGEDPAKPEATDPEGPPAALGCLRKRSRGVTIWLEEGAGGTWLSPLRLGERNEPRARDFTSELCTPMPPSPWGFLDHRQEINLVESQSDSHRDAFKARPVTEGVA